MSDNKKDKKIKKSARKKDRGKRIEEKLLTHNGHILTVNQKKFIDNYLEGGVARQAYIDAYRGPETLPKDTPVTAKNVARELDGSIICGIDGKPITNPDQLVHRLLSNLYIVEEIKYLQEERSKLTMASGIEVMNFFAQVMRGEIKDQFGLDPSLSDRISAGKELAKRTVDIDNRMDGKKDAEVHITLDWKRD